MGFQVEADYFAGWQKFLEEWSPVGPPPFPNNYAEPWSAYTPDYPYGFIEHWTPAEYPDFVGSYSEEWSE